MTQSAWCAGRLINYQDAQLDTAGWPEGSGIFETIKTVQGKPWALSRHMRRALNTARRNDQPFPNEELIRSSVAETIAANPFPIGRLRLLFAVDGNLRVTHQAYFEVSANANLGILHSTEQSSSRVEKRYPYTKNLEFLTQAKNAGLDDFVITNRDGFITETAIANLIFEIDGDWITPPLSDGVLPGVMRALLIERNGVVVRQIRASQLNEIGSGFVVSSLKIAQPIGRIGDQVLAISPESEQKRVEFATTALATSVG
jgi:branched-chain amino acid aminotransferase